MGHRADLTRRRGLRRLGEPNPTASATRLRLQGFPLLADPHRLQQFCDRWFNDYIPPSVAYFRPALPLVLCGVVHYPEMSGELPWQTGTLSQNEVYFLVPLERHRQVGRRWEFVEFGATTPYIFVDNAESAVAGRERFGMPKQDAVFTTGTRALPWPTGTQPYLGVEAWNPTATGHCLGSLLQIVRSPSASPTEPFGIDLGALPRVGRPTMASLLWWARAAAGAAGDPARGGAGLLTAARRVFTALRRSRTLTLFNLRQFADPEYSDAARYQDLVAFKMQIVDTQAVGLLAPLWAPAAFQLLLRKSAVHPIVQRLGLRVTRQRPDAHEAGMGRDDVADAIAPFFAEGDVDLVGARTLCSRHADHGWRDAGGRPLTPDGGGRARYNRTLGPGAAAFLEPGLAEPLDFKFLLLPADAGSLRRFVTAMMPDSMPLTIEPLVAGELGAVRVALYHSRPRRRAEQETLMWLDGCYTSLSIPVRFSNDGETTSALLMLHDFADNPFLVQAIRELTVGPTSLAQFESEHCTWFSTTRRYARPMGLTTLSLERSATAARVVQTPLLDILTVGANVGLPPVASPSALARLGAELWPSVGAILPILTIGSIPSAGKPERRIASRVMLTEFGEVRDADAGPGEAASGRQHVVRLHDSETYDLWTDLGLRCLDAGAHVLAHELRDDAVGRTHLVPVVRYGEAAYTIGYRRFKVLWEALEQEGPGSR